MKCDCEYYRVILDDIQRRLTRLQAAVSDLSAEVAGNSVTIPYMATKVQFMQLVTAIAEGKLSQVSNQLIESCLNRK